MAKVPLRVYNSDIEKLIEGGQIQEAIAHCRHILKIFPKLIDTYRLLGKAFLESQRYTEAADILRRVLSVLPDDFISHLGMSIISEDEGNLDAAIFHMEKAFEIQPASQAIQGELRRLYGRRDGVEPPRIRLNRGALVRMYARGELFPQAIAEATAALQEDPQRTDLQVILARLYYLSGQTVQAVEAASALVSKLPFCYEANRILSEVLPGSTRSEDAQIYKQRLEALDPYTGLVTPSMPISADVPDVAIQIDRLDYVASSDVAETPEWTQNIGVAWEDSEPDASPAWMELEKQANQPTSLDYEITPDETAPAAEADIPAWMATAGWAPAGNDVDSDNKISFDDDEESSQVAAGEIPEWLRSLAPADDVPTGSALENVEEDEQWVTLLGGETSPKEEATGPGTTAPFEAISDETEALPEWLSDLAPAIPDQSDAIVIDQISVETIEASAGTEVPEWLSPLETSDQADTEPQQLDPRTEALIGDVETSPLPGWLDDIAVSQSDHMDQVPENMIDENVSSEVESTDVPDWLKDMTPAQITQPDQMEPLNLEQPLEASGTFSDEEETPAWLKSIETAEFASPQETTVSAAVENIDNGLNPEDDMDAALAWLEALAAKQGADEATLLTPSDDRRESMPAWLQQQAEAQSDPTPEVPQTEMTFDALEQSQERPIDQEPDNQLETLIVAESEINAETSVDEIARDLPGAEMTIESPVSEFEAASQEEEILTQPALSSSDMTEDADMDAAFAWLESLAEKQGAEESTLLVHPKDRTEAPPDWLVNVSSETTQPQAETKTEETPEASVDGITSEEWKDLQSTAEVLPDAQTVEPPAEKTQPVWINPTGFEDINNEAALAAVTKAETTDTLFAEETVQDAVEVEAIAETPEESSETAQEIATAEETVDLQAAIPDGWQTEESVIAEPVASQDLPSWLSDLEPVPSGGTETEPSAETELPDWLRELEAPAQGSPEQSAVILTPAEWISEENVTAQPPVEAEVAAPVLETEPELASENLVESEPVGEESAAPGESDAPETGTRLNLAQQALRKGNVEKAVETYTELIQSGELLEETIHDLRDATYRFPMDTVIWQTLGDAYLRGNRMQEALDAYTKAEELLR